MHLCGTMKIEEIEAKVIELIYREPFVIEFKDGRSLEVPLPRLAINATGAGFIDEEGALVGVEFDQVRSIRVASAAGTR